MLLFRYSYILKLERVIAYTLTTLVTCSKPRHPRRSVPVGRVARSQLPGIVPAPAVDYAAAQHGTRVALSCCEGRDCCVRWQSVKA